MISEKEYKRAKKHLILGSCVFVLSIGYFIWCTYKYFTQGADAGHVIASFVWMVCFIPSILRDRKIVKEYEQQ